MKHVNQKATRVLDALTANLNEPGDHTKIENSGGTYMAVVVECIGRLMIGAMDCPLFSVAHYGEQNGDLMRDPDVEMARTDDGKYYPVSFRNDYAGVTQNAVECDNGKITGIRPKLQRDITTFVGQWMMNIRDQQGI